MEQGFLPPVKYLFPAGLAELYLCLGIPSPGIWAVSALTLSKIRVFWEM